MGKIEHMQIVLDRPNHVYIAGERVKGTVKIRVSEKLKINFVQLTIKGHVFVSWEEISYSLQNKSKSKEKLSSHEYPFKHEQTLVEKNKSELGDLFLDVGDHDYEFEYTLPDDCPTSFEHTHARIRYSVHAHLDIPWAIDLYGAMSFTVINPYDLNQSKSSLIKPYGLNQTIGDKMCCKKADPIAPIPNLQAGFVPGEYIHFKVDILNGTTSELENIRVKVMQKVHIIADGKSRTYRHSLGFMAMHKKIHPNSEEVWDSAYHIPAVCPTLDEISHILEIKYYFILLIDLHTAATYAKEMSIPITIGTVPLHEDKFVVRSGKVETNGSKHVVPEQTFNQVEHEHEIPPVYCYAEKGEALVVDSATYKPVYPYFKDFKRKTNVEEPTMVENIADEYQ